MKGFVNTLYGMIKAIKDKLGNTNISTIGDGTVTGAINTINADLSAKTVITTGYDTSTFNSLLLAYSHVGNVCTVSAMVYCNNTWQNGWKQVCSNLPKGYVEYPVLYAWNSSDGGTLFATIEQGVLNVGMNCYNTGWIRVTGSYITA